MYGNISSFISVGTRIISHVSMKIFKGTFVNIFVYIRISSMYSNSILHSFHNRLLAMRCLLLSVKVSIISDLTSWKFSWRKLLSQFRMDGVLCVIFKTMGVRLHINEFTHLFCGDQRIVRNFNVFFSLSLFYFSWTSYDPYWYRENIVDVFSSTKITLINTENPFFKPN